MKELNDMSDEELWTLFPILLTEHQENWKGLVYTGRRTTPNLCRGKHISHPTHREHSRKRIDSQTYHRHIIRDKRRYRHRSLYQKD